MKITAAILAYLFLVSCSRDPLITTNPASNPNQPRRLPLGPFSVTVVDRAPATAIIVWDEVVNLNDNDTVKYKIKLNNKIVDSNLIRLTDTIRNLSQDTAYTGRVYAYTKSGDTVSAPFFLEQLAGFIFFGDDDYTIQCYNIYSGNRVWRTQSIASSRFYGMPTIANGVLYINGSQSGTWAFDAKMGAKIWNATFSSRYPNGSSVNPVYVNGKLYTVMPGGIYSLNSSNGSVVWSYPLTEDFEVNPVMAGNLLITARAASSSTILAINIQTGLKAWEFVIGTSICQNPVVHTNALIFGGQDGKIYALDCTTGKLIWSRDFSVNYSNKGASSTSPVTYQNLVIVNNGNSGYYGLNAATGATVWNYNPGTPNTSSPAIGNDKMYFAVDDYPDSKAVALLAATGQLVWERMLPTGKAWPSPIFAKNRLYFGNNLTSGYGTLVLNAGTGTLLMRLAGNVYQRGKETIVDSDTTHYLAESGMVQ